MLIHFGGWFVYFDLVYTHESLEIRVKICRVHDGCEHRGTAVGEHDHRIACIFQALQAGFDIGEALKVVVAGHERVFLPGVEVVPGCCKGVVERFAGDLFKVFVAVHGGETEGELELFLSPYFCDTLSILGDVLFELFPDTDNILQIFQRPGV